MQSVKLMQWVSIFLGLAIGGMGFAPVAEYAGLDWLVFVCRWVAYISVFFLTIAAFVTGGLGLYHGYLVLTGQDVPTVYGKSERT